MSPHRVGRIKWRHSCKVLGLEPSAGIQCTLTFCPLYLPCQVTALRAPGNVSGTHPLLWPGAGNRGGTTSGGRWCSAKGHGSGRWRPIPGAKEADPPPHGLWDERGVWHQPAKGRKRTTWARQGQETAISGVNGKNTRK